MATTRRSLREIVMVCLYQYLLLKKDIREIIEDNCKLDLNEVDPYILDCIIECLENQDDYIARINRNLKDWQFERLGYIEQSILLLGTHEIISQNIDRAVVINEAIELSKKYCDDTSYKFINGVLDNL